MGAVLSCITNLCAMIGDAIMLVVDAIFGLVIFIAQAIIGLFDIIVSIITLQWCRRGSRYGWGRGMGQSRRRFGRSHTRTTSRI